MENVRMQDGEGIETNLALRAGRSLLETLERTREEA